MTEMYPLISKIHATIPAPARRTLHAQEATTRWLWQWQGRAGAMGWWNVSGKGTVHPLVSECDSLAFLGWELSLS